MGSLSALNERFAHASTHSSEAFNNYHQTSFVSPEQLKTSARRLQLYRLLRGGSFSVSQSSLPFLAVGRRACMATDVAGFSGITKLLCMQQGNGYSLAGVQVIFEKVELSTSLTKFR